MPTTYKPSSLKRPYSRIQNKKERKCSRAFAITRTTSFPGKIKVFDGVYYI
jgi:hypothetical protein